MNSFHRNRCKVSEGPVHVYQEMLRDLTTSEVLERIKGFDRRYVNHWSEWLRVSQGCDFQVAPIPILVVIEFGQIIRKWQACRPKPCRSVTELQSTLGVVPEHESVTEITDEVCPSVDDSNGPVWALSAAFANLPLRSAALGGFA